ncbi:MAG TPA: DUF488 domain-containing protein [Burkholderiaceae bacterium]|nr:DUF488 domain-containing protein [Burkholderiaceae bacterium]
MSRSSVPTSHVRVKRAYEPASPDDGVRILIDRLWPRGVSKDKAALDDWMKDLAPSTELRQWFGHDPARWDEFQQRYGAELDQNPEALDRVRTLAKTQTVTLVYSAHDEAHCNAVVLRNVLLDGKAHGK